MLDFHGLHCFGLEAISSFPPDGESYGVLTSSIGIGRGACRLGVVLLHCRVPVQGAGHMSVPCALWSLGAGANARCRRGVIARCLWQFEFWSLHVVVAAGRCRVPLPDVYGSAGFGC